VPAIARSESRKGPVPHAMKPATASARVAWIVGVALCAACAQGSLDRRKSLPLVTRQKDLEREAAHWLAGKDFRGLEPVSVTGNPPVFGAALADDARVSGWARNEQLAPPEWNAPALSRARLQVSLPASVPDATWSVLLTNPEDGSQTEVAGSSRAGLLAFEIERTFDSVAFEAVRGELTSTSEPSACASSESEVCAGAEYRLVLDGQRLSANTECRGAVDLTFTSCRNSFWMDLSSCPSGATAPPTSCISLRVEHLDGERTGSGTYYDSAGVRFDLTVRELTAEPELALGTLGEERIRSGVVRGDLTASDGAMRPFELSFSACSHRLVGCLY
jgi:hypothetical protein